MARIKNATAFFTVLIYFLFTLNSCNTGNKNKKDQSDEHNLDVRSVIDETKADHFLSELSKEIVFIPLETDAAGYLRSINWLDVTQDYILVSDSRGLFQFDRSGKFVKEIGKIGKGPGEHNGRIRFAVDAIHNEVSIYSFGTGLVNVHDLDTGRYKHSFDADPYISDFVFLPSDRIAFFTMETEINKNEVYLTDKRGELIDSIPNNLRSEIKGNVSGTASVYLHDQNWYYMYNYRDTLYRINEESHRAPFAIFNLDNKDSRDDFVIYPHPGTNFFPDFLSVQRVLHTSNYLFATIQKGMGDGTLNNLDRRRMVFSKSTGKLVMTEGFVDDLEGGMNFWPQWSRGDLLIASYQSYEIIDYYEETKGKTEHSSKFINLVNNLKVEDNPVLVLVENTK